jgi:hypothetical protein
LIKSGKLKQLEKVTEIILSFLLILLLHYSHEQANGTGRWKVPADDMKHIRDTSNNYGELPAAVVSRRGLFLEPDSSGVSRFTWSLFF